VGKKIAERAAGKGVKQVVFYRGGLYLSRACQERWPMLPASLAWNLKQRIVKWRVNQAASKNSDSEFVDSAGPQSIASAKLVKGGLRFGFAHSSSSVTGAASVLARQCA